MSTSGGVGQQVAERGAELLGVVDGGRGVDARPGAAPAAAAPSGRGSRAAASKRSASIVRGVAVAAVLEHPREQLLDRLLRAPAPRARPRRRAASAATSAPAARRSGRGTRSRPRAPARPRARGARRRRRRPRPARPRAGSTSSRRTTASSRSNGPGEDVEVEVELGDGHRQPERARRRLGGPMPMRLAHVGERRRGDRARLLGAGGEGRLERRLVGAQLGVALADRREVARPPPRRPPS